MSNQQLICGEIHNVADGPCGKPAPYIAVLFGTQLPVCEEHVRDHNPKYVFPVE